MYKLRDQSLLTELDTDLPSSSASLIASRHTIAMATHDVPKTCKVILAETIARGLLAEVKDTLKSIQQDSESRPTLVAFLANDDPAAIKYAEWSKKTCEER